MNWGGGMGKYTNIARYYKNKPRYKKKAIASSFLVNSYVAATLNENEQ